ncbi:hypothetical protein DIURU_005181 [Diutina rugosa]|uniref:JmjC domain-containing protein n=1 Tax=Diutina rugosa TaxID=5481 RepID=A0A642UEI9_DIURU|nr:uncharacterized protein DIURU_005181 [Diutina rugosa]KAA8897582.1 hypothetical protein DIURU_005181 [Diutina rugosa]
MASTKRIKGEYTRWTPSESGSTETLDVSSDEYNPNKLFSEYVVARKPVKLRGSVSDFNWQALDLDAIEATLDYDDHLWVEEKHSGGFGGGHQRVRMTLAELVDQLKQGVDRYYLTTQYDQEEDNTGEDGDDDEEDEEKVTDQVEASEQKIGDDEEEDDFDDSDEEEGDDSDDADARLRQLLQPPLTNLIFNPEFPINHPLLPTLIPQQINLWMGQAPKSSQTRPEIDTTKPDGGLGRYIPPVTHEGAQLTGTSSGLHHDHADNLYVVVSGVKRFTLFPPSNVYDLNTVGTVYRVFNSGVIDYVADSKSPNWHQLRDDGAVVAQVEAWKNGKEAEETSEGNIGGENDYNNKAKHPPSFSTIPPALLHIDDVEDDEYREKLMALTRESYPQLLSLPRLTVWLKPGEMLYLPTGWFHEVSSFGDQPHIAVNYWFIPPVTGKYADPYHDDNYWQSDWAKTKAVVDSMRALAVSDDDEEDEEDEEEGDELEEEDEAEDDE